MTTWLIATALAFAGLLVTLVALFSGGARTTARGPREPDWLIPSPVEVRRADFPIAWRGYDAAQVDVYLDALATAYQELYFAAGPSAVARARERLALRLGRVTPAPDAGNAPDAGTARDAGNASDAGTARGPGPTSDPGSDRSSGG